MLIPLLIFISVLMGLFCTQSEAAGEAGMPDVNDAAPGRADSGTSKTEEVKNPAVLSGLKVTAEKGKLRVQAGRAEIRDLVANLNTDVMLDAVAPDPIPVEEEVRLWTDPPNRWQSRTLRR